MYIVTYLLRAFIMLMVTWLALRIVGKKSIAQMTSYELAGIMLLTTVAAEPLVFKVVSKASIGALFIALVVLAVGALSLRKKFYNADMRPDVIIQNGKIYKEALKRNKMNLPLFLSMLRLKGYANVSDIEFAVIEPNGQISAIPKSASRPLQPSDMQIQPQFEGIPLPVIIDGEIQYNNLKYVNLNAEWLQQELKKANISTASDVFLAQLNSQNQLYLSLYKDVPTQKPPEI